MSGFTSSGAVPAPRPASLPAIASLVRNVCANASTDSFSVASVSSERSPDSLIVPRTSVRESR